MALFFLSSLWKLAARPYIIHSLQVRFEWCLVQWLVQSQVNVQFVFLRLNPVLLCHLVRGNVFSNLNPVAKALNKYCYSCHVLPSLSKLKCLVSFFTLQKSRFKRIYLYSCYNEKKGYLQYSLSISPHIVIKSSLGLLHSWSARSIQSSECPTRTRCWGQGWMRGGH